jgi:hypothetical protein
MCGPRHLRTPWACTACYRDSFIYNFVGLYMNNQSLEYHNTASSVMLKGKGKVLLILIELSITPWKHIGKWKYNSIIPNLLPLWSSGLSSWLQIQRSGFDLRRYQIFRKVVVLERGPLSLVSTTEELLGSNSSGSGLERREYGGKDPSSWPRGTL